MLFVCCCQLLMIPLIMSVLYVWAQFNKETVVSFWFGTRFKVPRRFLTDTFDLLKRTSRFTAISKHITPRVCNVMDGEHVTFITHYLSWPNVSLVLMFMSMMFHILLS